MAYSGDGWQPECLLCARRCIMLDPPSSDAIIRQPERGARPMPEELPGPFIGPTEQSLFAIPETRERATRLREQLTPKLALILEWACGDIEDAYGAGSLDPYRIVLTPANRRKSVNTKPYHAASAGLAMKSTEAERQHWYFQQRIECSDSHILAGMFGNRGREANPIVTVMKRHDLEVARLLDYREAFLWQDGLYADDEEEDRSSVLPFLAKLRTGAERDWGVKLSVEGPDVDLPILDRDAARPVIFDFVAMFPVFRAATDIVLGNEDRFPGYARHFWAWAATLVEDEDGEPPDVEGLEEGFLKVALKQHRTRERRLRKRKIRNALRRGDGRLRCEVPGCGFDFLAVYGEIGRDFAHVHHLEPLARAAGPRRTKMGDLAIVCANCHAMVHRGGKCLPLAGLIGVTLGS